MNYANSETGAAQSDVIAAAGSPIDASLAEVIDAWENLSDDARQAILAIVKGAQV